MYKETQHLGVFP